MNAPSTAELLLRMTVSLAIMGGLLWLVLRVTRSRRGRSLLGVGGGGRVEPIEVCARRQLTRSAAVYVVRVGARTLMLGVTEGRVEVLAEGDALDATPRTGRDAALVAATAVGLLTTGISHDDQEAAGTRAPGATAPNPTRMGVIEALRELTVRR